MYSTLPVYMPRERERVSERGRVKKRFRNKVLFMVYWHTTLGCICSWWHGYFMSLARFATKIPPKVTVASPHTLQKTFSILICEFMRIWNRRNQPIQPRSMRNESVFVSSTQTHTHRLYPWWLWHRQKPPNIVGRFRSFSLVHKTNNTTLTWNQCFPWAQPQESEWKRINLTVWAAWFQSLSIK